MTDLPVKISKPLTDNGSQVTDRLTVGGTHMFDRLCKRHGIEHRLVPPRHRQTNGMVERFNGRISDIINQTRFGSAAELESSLRNYVKIYNHSIPRRELKHKTPVQALKDWHKKRPELFRKRVYNQSGLASISSETPGRPAGALLRTAKKSIGRKDGQLCPTQI